MVLGELLLTRNDFCGCCKSQYRTTRSLPAQIKNCCLEMRTPVVPPCSLPKLLHKFSSSSPITFTFNARFNTVGTKPQLYTNPLLLFEYANFFRLLSDDLYGVDRNDVAEPMEDNCGFCPGISALDTVLLRFCTL